MSNYFIPEKDTVNTILEEGTILDGDLSFSTSLEIRGHFKGVIRSKGLVVIAKTAFIEAMIFSSNIVIKGTVKGDILAYNKLEIEEEGKVFGNIKTHKIKVTDGVIFEGDCATLSQESLEKEFYEATKNIISEIDANSIPLAEISKKDKIDHLVGKQELTETVSPTEKPSLKNHPQPNNKSKKR